MSINITVYTSTNCSSCQRAKAFLAGHQIDFKECNLSDDTAALNELMRLGCRSLPVIRIDGKILEGFNPTELTRLLGL